MRIASYNVENLFARAKAMNLDWSEGGPILKAQADLNNLFAADAYTDAPTHRYTLNCEEPLFAA